MRKRNLDVVNDLACYVVRHYDRYEQNSCTCAVAVHLAGLLFNLGVNNVNIKNVRVNVDMMMYYLDRLYTKELRDKSSCKKVNK